MNDWLSLSPRTKSMLLLGATLLLGVILGAVLNAWWAQERFERLRRLRAPGGFEAMVMQTVDPASDAQRREVRRVVDRAAARIDTLRRHHVRDLRGAVLQMRTELEPILSDRQLQRLTRRLRMHGRRALGPPRRGVPRPGASRPGASRPDTAQPAPPIDSLP
jgi:hypothetical protein